MSLDAHMMHHALALARRGLGRVAPNPSVGCVIVKAGHVIGCGYTSDGGRPHAERNGLDHAGSAARGATAYVTLEPCAHERTDGNCTHALINAGIARAVIACADPDPRTAGQGIHALRAAGIVVDVGVLEREAQDLNRGFFLRVLEQRPFVTLHMAFSADEKIAGPGGARAQITGPLAQRHLHLERSMHDAILVGAGTVQKDDPLLTTRLPGVHHRITRVVLDSQLYISPDSALVRSIDAAPLWVLHDGTNTKAAKTLADSGVELIISERDIKSALQTLAARGITRLLVEGGARVWASLLESGLYDRILCYRSPVAIPDGIAAFRFDPAEFHNTETRILGDDRLDIYQGADT